MSCFGVPTRTNDTGMSDEEILYVPLGYWDGGEEGVGNWIECADSDSGASTVGGYLAALLKELWKEEEGFSGKRPFGNSGWKYIAEESLVHAGFLNADIYAAIAFLDRDPNPVDILAKDILEIAPDAEAPFIANGLIKKGWKK